MTGRFCVMFICIIALGACNQGGSSSTDDVAPGATGNEALEEISELWPALAAAVCAEYEECFGAAYAQRTYWQGDCVGVATGLADESYFEIATAQAQGTASYDVGAALKDPLEFSLVATA